MNRSELIAALAAQHALPGPIAEQIVTIFFDEIRETLIDDGRVELRGFGTFEVRRYGSYEGRNPRTGISMIVPRKRLPFFRPGKRLREEVDPNTHLPSGVTAAPGEEP